MNDVVQSMDGSEPKGGMASIVYFEGDDIKFKGESRRRFDYEGITVEELLFPRPDIGPKSRTLLWCKFPFGQACFEVNKKIIPNPLFHITFDTEDVAVAKEKVKEAFNAHYGIKK